MKRWNVKFAIVALSLNFSMFSVARAEECTRFWNYTSEINSPNPKPMSGDSFAAYALIGWVHQPHLQIIIKGEYPKGRFMSLESYKTQDKKHVDALFDFEILPDAGSENPFQEGAPVDLANRSYTVTAKVSSEEEPNVLRLDPHTNIHSIFYRWYVPVDGVAPNDADRPKIFAVDARTGESRKCPQIVDTQFTPGIERVILRLIPRKKVLTFKDAGIVSNGTNHAIPSYTYALTRLTRGDVAVVRFKAPTFIDTQSGTGEFSHNAQTRYWSLCAQNLKVSETLNCMPDYLSKFDANGYTTIVYSKNKKVKEAAEKRGFGFMPDLRKADQPVVAFLYRNVLPQEDFARYEGAFCARGVTCSAKEFLSGQCMKTSHLNDCQ